MLITQLLATALIVVGCCIAIYVTGVYCYCVVCDTDLDEDKVMGRVYIMLGVMGFIFMLTLFSLIYELTLHLIP